MLSQQFAAGLVVVCWISDLKLLYRILIRLEAIGFSRILDSLYSIRFGGVHAFAIYTTLFHHYDMVAYN